MITKEIKVFEFEELSREAQKIAIEKYINSIDHIDLSWLIWDFAQEAKEFGFFGTKFNYSIGYCQGDGLSFSFSYFDSEKLREIIKEITGKNSNWFLDLIQNSIYSIKGKENMGHYCYAKENQVELEENYIAFNYPNIMETNQKILERIQEIYMNLCDDFKKRAYDQYEYELSEENAKFMLIENEIQFLETGQTF